MKKGLLLLLVFSITIELIAQESIITLSSALSGTKSYIARDAVILDAGFSYSASSGCTFTASTDESLIIAADYSETQYNPDTYTLNPSLVAGYQTGLAGASPSGAATYSIPIYTPTGILGMEPTVSLLYNSLIGNGPLGQGFGISGLSSIRKINLPYYAREESSNILSYLNSQYALDGNRLVLISGTHGYDGAVYKTESETYSEIILHNDGDTTGIWFEVKLKDGMNLEYTFSNEAYGYFLTKIKDPKGNYLIYFYGIDPTTYEPYLSSINYTGNENIGLQPCNTISFYYDKRNDINTIGFRGAQLFSTLILRKIEVNVLSNIQRVYKLSYFHDLYSYLNKVEEYDPAGVLLSSTMIKWGETGPSYTLEDQPDLDFSLNYKRLTGDFNGDGQYDLIVYPNKTTYLPTDKWSLYLLQNNSFELASEGFLGTSFKSMIIGDLESDGKDEFIFKYFSPGSTQFRSYEYSNSTISYLSTLFTFSSTDEKIEIKLGDFDGNGVADYMCTEGDNDIIGLNGFVGSNVYPILSQPYCVFFGDVNGDKRSDIISIKADIMNVYSYDLSTTQFTKIITNYALSSFSNVKPGDFNGDGLTDFLFIKRQSGGCNVPFYIYTKILFSTGSNFFAVDGPTFVGSECSETPTEQYSEVTQTEDWDVGFTVTDINVDGKSDILTTEWMHNVTYQEYHVINDEDIYVYKAFLSSGISFKNYSIDLTGELILTDPYDRNFDGIPDFYVAVNEDFSSISFFKDILNNYVKSITSSANLKTEFNYANLMGSDTYYEENESYPTHVHRVSLPIKLLSSYTITDQNLQRELAHVRFRYSNLKVHTQGKGLLGFSAVTSKNLIKGDSTIVNYNIDPNFCVPYQASMKEFINSNAISETSNTQIFNSLDGGKRYSTYTSAVNKRNLLDNTSQYQLLSVDSNGNITSKESGVKNASSETVKSTVETFSNYNTFGSPGSVSITNSRGTSTISRQTTATYNTLGLPTALVQQFGNSPSINSSFTYDSFGNLLTETTLCNGISKTNSYVYEPGRARFVTERTNSMGQKTIFNIDGLTCNLIEQTDNTGLITAYEYDQLGRLTKTIYPDETTQLISRGWSNNTQNTGELFYEQVLKTGEPATITYFDITDKKTRIKTQSFNGQYLISDTNYDNMGRVISKYSPYFEGVTPTEYVLYTYDSYGRVSTETVMPNNVTSNYSYGPLETTVLRNDRTYETLFDATGQRIQITEPGGSIHYAYNAEDKPLTIVSPSGTTSITYDDYGNQKTLSDIDAGLTSYTYNGFGNMVTYTDANGNTVTYSYDSAGRVISESWNSGFMKNFEYYSESGLLQRSFTSEGLEFTRVYDKFHRVLSETQKNDANNTFTKSYAYNALGQLASSVTNSQITEAYLYNSYGYQYQHLVNGTLVWSAVSQNERGIIDNFNLRNSNETTVLSFDTYGFPMGISTTDAGQTIQNWTYSYDHSTGNMLSRTGLKTDGTTVIESFTYDNQDRLTSFTVGANTINTSFDTSGKGNITNKTDVGSYIYSSKVHVPNYISNPTTELAALPAQSIDYTPFNKIKTLTQTFDDGTVKELSLIYSPFNERAKQVFKLNGQEISTKYYAFGNYEKEVSSVSTRDLYYINTPSGTVAVAELNAGTISLYYIHKDVLGSFDVITKSDGTIQERNNFDPWGRKRNLADWSYNSVSATLFTGRGFTGHEHLIDFGLINMNGRVYDPVLAMFLSPDNYIQAPGMVQSFNRYGYCINNPLIYTDPTGEKWWHWLIGEILSGGMLSLGTVSTYTSALATIPLIHGTMTTIDYGSIWFLAFNDSGAAGKRFENALKIDFGLAMSMTGIFKYDKSASGLEYFKQVINGISGGEIFQSTFGNGFAHYENVCGNIDEIGYYEGRTIVRVKEDSFNKYSGVSHGYYVFGENIALNPQDKEHDVDLFAHEFGHTYQSRITGPLYYFKYGLKSAFKVQFPEDDADYRAHSNLGIWPNGRETNPTRFNFWDMIIGPMVIYR